MFKKRSSNEQIAPRRRPLSGDLPAMRSTEVFSYHAHRSGSTANVGRLDAAAIESLHPVARTRWYAATWAVVAVFGVLLLAVMALTALGGQPRVVLKSTASSRYFLQDESVYRQAITKYLRSSLLHQNKLTLNEADLARTIAHDYPEIKSVVVHKPLIGTSPEVTLTPYDASYILTTTAADAVILDENGHAMVPAGRVADSAGMGLLTIQDKSGRAVAPGAQALPRTTIQFIDTVAAVLKSQNIAITNLVLPAASSELDVYLTGKPYYAKVNLQGDARLQAGTLVATAKQFEKDKVTPMQYVDVRVPGRAYYK